ncbi:MAG: hypothetical protein WD200_03950 [Candidatus Andersenbacteria bacterium]
MLDTKLQGWKLLWLELWKDKARFQELSYVRYLDNGSETVIVFIRQETPASVACVSAERTSYDASYRQYRRVEDVMSEAEVGELIRLFKALSGAAEDVTVQLL